MAASGPTYGYRGSLMENNARAIKEALEPVSSLDMAQRYAKLGWRVMPVNGKRPTLKDWPNKATCTTHEVNKWFNRDCNIGIATGKGSGIVVLDVDPRNGGEVTLKRLERQLGTLPATVRAATGGGGSHLVFKWFSGAKSTSQDGLDFLADKKMFVAAPSIHPKTGARYQWLSTPFNSPILELPEPWKIQFSNTNSKVSASTCVTTGKRHSHLLSMAGKLKAEGQSQTYVKNKLLEINATECSPPLGSEEVISIVYSVFSYQHSGQSVKTRWQQSIWESNDLSGSAKLVLQALAFFADEHGKSCWPTQEKVAEYACCSAKTVGRRLAEATEEGWILRYTQPRAAGAGFNYGYVLKLKDQTESPNLP